MVIYIFLSSLVTFSSGTSADTPMAYVLVIVAFSIVLGFTRDHFRNEGLGTSISGLPYAGTAMLIQSSLKPTRFRIPMLPLSFFFCH